MLWELLLWDRLLWDLLLLCDRLLCDRLLWELLLWGPAHALLWRPALLWGLLALGYRVLRSRLLDRCACLLSLAGLLAHLTGAGSLLPARLAVPFGALLLARLLASPGTVPVP